MNDWGKKMSAKKAEWPEPGDLVIASVQRITDYGAYVTLDEYGKEGLLHVSEVSSGWVRNIRDFVREGQKTVLKILRVDTEKGHVDLSLRRVSRHERREKILSWKKERKAESLLRTVAEKLKMPIEELQAKTGAEIEEKFGGIYEGFERAAREGPEPLIEAGLPKDIVAVIAEVAKDKIRPPMVKIKGMLELRCSKPRGIIDIREALLSAQKLEKERNASIHLYAVAAPKYAIEVLAEDYKEAERILQKSAEAAIKSITNAGGAGVFQRGK
jgi:translation initiation factor 2 subunit 1